MMNIGVPREIKTLEGRVGLIPAACADLIHDGHRVRVQAGAGEAGGYPDDEYRVHGVELVADAPSLYAGADLIVKVKEPVDPELDLLRRDQQLFSYLHPALQDLFPNLPTG